MRFKSLPCVLISLACFTHVYAEDGCWSTMGSSVPQAHSFVVSGVLQKRSDTAVIKLIQSVETSNATDKALMLFADKVRKQYPEYLVLDALITEVNKESSVVCNRNNKEISV